MATIFALTAAVPLLSGLGYLSLAGIPSPPSLVYSAVFVGWILHQITSCAKGAKYEPEGEITDSRTRRTTEAGETSVLSERWTIVTVKRYSTIQLAAEVLITAVLASLVMQVARHHGEGKFWTIFWSQSVFGYGDPLYFLTSAFVWLQGLFFFRMLIRGAGKISLSPSATHRETQITAGLQKSGCGFRKPDNESPVALDNQMIKAESNRAPDTVVLAWVRPAFIVFGLSTAVFYLFQRLFGVPDSHDTARCCAPFEDIHSFGSFVVTLFIFGVASWRKNVWPKMIFRGIWIIGLLALVVLSWSRATWLAGVICLLLLGWLRLPKRWIFLPLVLLSAAIAMINLNANRESWGRNEYLWRLSSLVRIENLEAKDPDRIHLYQKALAMIREHPLIGHGIGSFYLNSEHYARPGDPYATLPDFAHNFILQLAAELGLPCTALFVAFIGYALFHGYRQWKAKYQDVAAEPAEPLRSKLPPLQNEIFGTVMALTAYLITQMTANGLNIYITNQFFFWFMMAAVLMTADNGSLAFTGGTDEGSAVVRERG